MTAAAASIDLEMFEVGLGSAIFLRLRRVDGDVCILADGGVGRSLAASHVQAKVKVLLAHDDEPHLDLVIGTHYDEDHLRGLVPIIDSAIGIGELWLPPVIDDTAMIVGDVVPRDADLLGERLVRDKRHLPRYVDAKLDDIRRCREVERILTGDERDAGDPIEIGVDCSERADRVLALLRLELGVEGIDAVHDDGCEHFDTADAFEELPASDRWNASTNFHEPYWPLEMLGRPNIHLLFAERLRHAERQRPATYSVGRIRRAAAKDAINAIALNDLVQAATRRKVPIRYRHIKRGQPEVFRWAPKSRRFVRGVTPGIGATQLVLLGPSETLVQKHAKRLPVLEAVALAMMSRIPVKSISPSNQMSYVVKVEHAEQAVLLCGDTGFSDFMTSRSKAEPSLLAALRRLDVIQVAHHGGYNQWFYRVLLEAWQDQDRPPPIMLLSHAQNDAHRPNEQFAQFVEQVGAVEDRRFILFTSRPLPARVAPFKEKVMLPIGSVARVGDVRLEYAAGNWTLRKHAIVV